MIYTLLIITLMLFSSCKKYNVDQEEEVGSIETKITLLNTENEELPYPISVFCINNKKQSVYKKEFGKGDDIIMTLPKGEFSINILCGANSESYTMTEDTNGNPVIEMKAGNTSSSPIKTTQAIANIEKTSEISLTPGYCVASVKFNIENVPEGVKSVSTSVSPVGRIYKIENGSYEIEETAVIPCTANGNTWKSEQKYIFPFKSSVTKIGVSLDYGDNTKNYSYTLMKGLEKGKPYSFSGSFDKDGETGEDILKMEGDFNIGKWDMEEEITIDFGEGSGNSNPGDNGEGDGNNSEIETFIVDEIPERFDIFGPMFIWKKEEISNKEAIVTVIAPQQWPDILTSEALHTIEGYSLDGITGWRMFTEEEAREFFIDFKGGGSEVNTILYENGHNIFYYENRERYLCDNAQKTFNLYGELRIIKAGEKTKYYLRPIKTMKLIKK